MASPDTWCPLPYTPLLYAGIATAVTAWSPPDETAVEDAAPDLFATA